MMFKDVTEIREDTLNAFVQHIKDEITWASRRYWDRISVHVPEYFTSEALYGIEVTLESAGYKVEFDQTNRMWIIKWM